MKFLLGLAYKDYKIEKEVEVADDEFDMEYMDLDDIIADVRDHELKEYREEEVKAWVEIVK